MTGKPASLGAIVMLGGGLLIYWALSKWKLFGLGGPSAPKMLKGSIPKSTSPSRIGGHQEH